MKALKALVPVLALAGAGVANAAVDVSSSVTEISGAATPIAAIGTAVFAVLVGIKVFKWIRRAM